MKEEYEKKLINDVIECIEKNDLKNSLSSIILTGSFGRNEPTYKMLENGMLKLKSDVEIALVYKKSSSKKEVNQIIKNVSNEFEEDLNLMPIEENRVRKAYNYNYSIVNQKYKTIFTYDLFNGSYTIWGKDFLKNQNIYLNQVDLYEAKRLVGNRIGELIYLSVTESKGKKDYLKKQWKGKLCLAIVSAWLICEGKYASAYHKQYELIKKNVDAVKKVLGDEFIEDYNRVFSFLREDGQEYEIPDSRMKQYVSYINKYLFEKKITKPKVNNMAREIKYLSKYIKSGMPLGIINFEDKIIQSLIDGYYEDRENLKDMAILWHNVLY